MPVKSASELDYPPFSMIKNNGEADGFSVELLRASLLAVGHDVTFEVGHWSDIKKQLELGSLEVLPLVGRTPEREDVFDFTSPYISLYGAVFAREENSHYKTLEDLHNLRIGVLKGDNSEEFVRRKNLTEHVITTASYEEAFNRLNNGEIDVVVAQRLVGLNLIEKLELSNIKSVISPLKEFRQDFCFAVTEGNKALLAQLNEGLMVVTSDGTYEQLKKKWLSILSKEQDEKARNYLILIWLISVLFIILVASFAIYRYRVYQEVKLSEEKYRFLYKNMAQGAFHRRADGTFVDYNDNLLKMFGLTADQLMGKASMDPRWKMIDEDGAILSGEEHPSMVALRTGEPVFKNSIGIFNPIINDIVWLSIKAIPMFREGETKPYQVFVTLHDVTENKHLENELRFLSLHDPLTKLYNRNELNAILDREVNRAKRNKGNFSVFMIDIDHFKKVNDDFGHHAGDTALCTVAKVIENSIRRSDQAARFGGEEFVVILADTGLSEATVLANRLCEKVSAHEVSLENGEKINLTISIGVATFPEHADNEVSLIKAADSAMYAAKSDGRDQVKTA